MKGKNFVLVPEMAFSHGTFGHIAVMTPHTLRGIQL